MGRGHGVHRPGRPGCGPCHGHVVTNFDPIGPFTVTQALEAGVSRSVLRGRRFQRVAHGVLIEASAPVDLATRARAAILTHPAGARISHATAAHLLGIPVPDDPQVHVTVPDRSKRRNRSGVSAHVGPASKHIVVAGVPVSSGDVLFVELAHTLSQVDAVVAGDAMIRMDHLVLSGLLDRLQVHPGHGRVRARSAARLLRAGVESAMESRVRLLLVLAGFPEPLINHELRHCDGHYRPDLCWPERRLIIEYDGQHHRNDLDQWDRDIIRREWFQSQGWQVVTLVARDVFHRPAQTLERIHTAWQECGGPPLRFDHEWRRHFPQRPSGNNDRANA